MIRQRIFTVVGLLLAPLVVLWATQTIWLDDLAQALSWMTAHPDAVGLFWVLFSAISFTLYGFLRRLFWACLPQSVVCLVFAYASRCKLNINGAPIQLSDFSLMGNLGDVAGYAAEQLIATLLSITTYTCSYGSRHASSLSTPSSTRIRLTTCSPSYMFICSIRFLFYNLQI